MTREYGFVLFLAAYGAYLYYFIIASKDEDAAILRVFIFIVLAGCAALSAFLRQAKRIGDLEQRLKDISKPKEQ